MIYDIHSQLFRKFLSTKYLPSSSSSLMKGIVPLQLVAETVGGNRIQGGFNSV